MIKPIHIVAMLLVPMMLTADEIETTSSTNLVIESNESDISLGWTRQALLDGGNGKVIDRSGTVISHAEVVALNVLATNLNQIAKAAHEGMMKAVGELEAVTNQVPSHAEHIALYFPSPSEPKNLMGEVIAEGSDGVTDWQTVRYSQKLLLAPNRHIEYTYLDTTATVECVWDKWDATSLVHRCTFQRPSVIRGIPIRSYMHDRMGGAKGFDFGSALVTVDGKPTFTGTWTNKLTGAEHLFRNGVLQKQTKETDE